MTSKKLILHELNDDCKELYNSNVTGLVALEGCMVSSYFATFAEKIIDYKVRTDDVFLCGFSKSGTIWSQEMLWCIINDLDFAKAKNVPIEERVPYFEMSCNYDTVKAGSTQDYNIDSLGFVEKLPGRRIVKTHLHLPLLPKDIQTEMRKAKIVYIARDPRDVCVSMYHYYNNLDFIKGGLDSMIELMIKDRVFFGPYWKHVLEYWNIRNQPNVLFITFEDMKKDLPSVINKVAAFIEKPLTSDQVGSLVDHLSFNNMKKNPAVNVNHPINENKNRKFDHMRKGKMGGFVEELTGTQIQTLNDWCEKNIEGTDYYLSI